MDKKYYIPTIEEFHVGFEYEYEDIVESGSSDFFKATIENASEIDDLFDDMYEHGNQIRVKYLDKEDIESLGFIDNPLQIPKQRIASLFHKVDPKSMVVIQIKVYWDQLKSGRENLIRIFKGVLHKYPYTEIFRGNIKNKNELKRLLKQLDVF